jgi:hypothetical protein
VPTAMLADPGSLRSLARRSFSETSGESALTAKTTYSLFKSAIGLKSV